MAAQSENSFKGQAVMLWKIITEKLQSYRAALREIAPSLSHITDQYENNRAEVPHQPSRQQERQMRRFKSPGQARRFLSFHSLVNNLYRQQRLSLLKTYPCSESITWLSSDFW